MSPNPKMKPNIPTDAASVTSPGLPQLPQPRGLDAEMLFRQEAQALIKENSREIERLTSRIVQLMRERGEASRCGDMEGVEARNRALADVRELRDALLEENQGHAQAGTFDVIPPTNS